MGRVDTRDYEKHTPLCWKTGGYAPALIFHIFPFSLIRRRAIYDCNDRFGARIPRPKGGAMRANLIRVVVVFAVALLFAGSVMVYQIRPCLAPSAYPTWARDCISYTLQIPLP